MDAYQTLGVGCGGYKDSFGQKLEQILFPLLASSQLSFTPTFAATPSFTPDPISVKMHYSYAVAAALLAGQAYAANVLPRQTPEDFLGMIPEACASPCQPLTSLQQECGSSTATQAEIMSCVCKPSTFSAMDACVTCVVTETLGEAAAGNDAAVKAGVDAAKQTFEDMCQGASTGTGGPTGGSSSSGNAGAGSSAGTATSPASGSTTTTGTQADANNSLGNGNSGARVEFAGSAILAVAGVVGAFLL